MRIYFINLDRCKPKRLKMESKFPTATRIVAVDGMAESPSSILPYTSERTWRDPSWNRRITKGEVGCILSHIKAWKICLDLQEPILILEDDVEVVDSSYPEKIAHYIKEYDFLYIAKRLVEGAPEHINNDLETPAFSYWCSAYCITPKVALALLDYFNTKPLIPADEVVPAILDLHRWPHLNQNLGFKSASFKKNLIQPVAGAFSMSETEKPEHIWKDYAMHILTVATDESKAQKLLNRQHNILNLGKDKLWKGGTMEGPGGGQKINLIRDYLYKINDDDIIMFVDGYDTFIDVSEDVILERYFSFRKEVVFSSELTCWPDKSLADQFPDPPEYGYKYLNSGTFIGTVRELKKIFAEKIQDHEDDQLYVQKQYLSGKFDIALDYESYIFMCLSGLEDSVAIKNNWIVNTDTNCTTCVIHGNGGEYTKNALDSLYEKRIDQTFNIVGSGTREVEIVDRDMFIIRNFLPETYCEALIEALEEDSRWQSLENDEYPAQEIRINALPDQRFIEAYKQVYNEVFIKYAREFWPKLTLYGIRDLFALKYTMETQSSLPLHHDMSLVTASIKLNDSYSGGVLNFPRQKIDNSSLNVGDAIVWPGQVTHPHECLPLASGTKYGLTMWTARLPENDFYIR